MQRTGLRELEQLVNAEFRDLRYLSESGELFVRWEAARLRWDSSSSCQRSGLIVDETLNFRHLSNSEMVFVKV